MLKKFSVKKFVMGLFIFLSIGMDAMTPSLRCLHGLHRIGNRPFCAAFFNDIAFTSKYNWNKPVSAVVLDVLGHVRKHDKQDAFIRKVKEECKVFPDIMYDPILCYNSERTLGLLMRMPFSPSRCECDDLVDFLHSWHVRVEELGYLTQDGKFTAGVKSEVARALVDMRAALCLINS